MAKRRAPDGLLLTAAALVAATACGRNHPPDPAHDVDIPARDGVILKGSYYSPGKPGPAVLLLHQCNMDRHAWDGLTPDLVKAGFHVLTYDQRGFGGTPGQGGPADASHGVDDAETAYAYLAAKPDVDKGRIAAGGASCGVTYSATLAGRRPEMKALVLLSGWADDKSRAHIRATPALAVFGAAAERSGSDAADLREALAASRHPQSSLRIVSGRGHGVAMFEEDAGLKDALVSWLVAQTR
jgi:dienelactone hydrolase